jgi:hypothetical protein
LHTVARSVARRVAIVSALISIPVATTVAIVYVDAYTTVVVGIPIDRIPLDPLSDGIGSDTETASGLRNRKTVARRIARRLYTVACGVSGCCLVIHG